MNTKDIGPRWVDTYMGHIAIRLMCTLPEAEQVAFYKKVPPGTGIDITVTMSGVEFDFEKFAEIVYKQLDTMVVEEAGKMLKEKTSDLTERLHDSIEQLTQGIRKQAMEHLGYNPWEHER